MMLRTMDDDVQDDAHDVNDCDNDTRDDDAYDDNAHDDG